LNRASSKDEIYELTEAATELTNHLSTTRQQLAEYTEELEVRVADRTRDLEESRTQLVEQVKTRNRELNTLNEIAELITRSFRLSDILPRVLEKTAGLIPAEGAAIYRLSGSGELANLELEVQQNAAKLTPRLVDRKVPEPGKVPQSLSEAIWIAADGDMSTFVCRRNKNCINVPLVCRDRVLGVMIFVGVDMEETSDEQKELLLSVGKQVGITIDSLLNVAALVQHKELLQSVFDGIPDIMVLMDRNRVIRMANRAYLKRHGRTLEQAIGRKCLALEGECDCSLAGTRLAEAMATRRQTREEITTQIGEIFRVYCYPILGEAGEVWGILRYAKDITLEKQVESRIQQTEKMAALGQLAAGVAHEINNPLGIILCYTDLLRRQLPDREESLQDLETIEKQAGNCQRIVSDLLNFSRSRKAEPVPVDVNQAVTEVVHMVQQQFEKKGTVLQTELEEGLPEVDLDTDRIQQVFLNLMMNAQQALDGRSGRILISTTFRRESSSIVVVVGDNGPGIPPEIRSQIFDPFFSTKQTGEGTGLGLSVSYGIVKEHGGDIEVRSNPGKWTEFVVTLPVRSETENRL
jgi:PAS domain S-box-containing protein